VPASADIAMFRLAPSVGLERRWHVLSQRLYGFALVAPPPCAFVPAAIQCEQITASRERLLTGETAVLERRCCRHCLTAVRGEISRAERART